MQIFSQCYWRRRGKVCPSLRGSGRRAKGSLRALPPPTGTPSQREGEETKTSHAFTLIEMMTVLAIVMVMTVIVLVNSNQMNSAMLLRGLASEVCLSIREAQLYGTSKEDDSASRNSVYGVHFDTASPQQYTLYKDDDSVPLKTYKLQTGFSISSLCVLSGSSWSCAGMCPSGLASCTSNSTSISSLDITFTHPDPNASFATNGSLAPSGYTRAIILVKSPQSAVAPREESVWNTGLIEVLGQS